MANLAEFTDQNFDAEVLQAEQPVLVDFWAPWCGPCRQLGPIVEQVAQEYEGRVKVGKLNVQDNPATAQKYNVMSIPLLVLFKGGQPVQQLLGLQPAEQIKAMLDSAL